ncbi:response regulator transcription factor [Streptomyces sp. CRN 30]|uniref:response regulator transcription factor n=1 Tax=Streptomyces sp. CRN 30 TaxID=3075613 RepID=UPI002A820CDB|nr:response regulator transcription factor [Streptomyces sp. CRN 30]
MTSPLPPVPLPPDAVRVVVVDDNPVVRAGLTALLSQSGSVTVVAEAADGREACEAADRTRPDVVLLDVRMTGVDGLAALPYLVRIAPVMMLTYSGESETVREALRRGAGGYLVHGEFTAEELVTAVRDAGAGRTHFSPTAAGAVLDQLRSASAYGHAENDRPYLAAEQASSPFPVEKLSRMQPDVGQSSGGRSGFQLSAREAEIMDLIASGMTNQQIAGACFISEKTVKNHINRIFAKLHSTSRAEATAKWLGNWGDAR